MTSWSSPFPFTLLHTLYTEMKETGKIIIVEGIWGAGKSTLISSLMKRPRTLHIPEPDHRESRLKTPKAITRWYFAAHHKNIARALAGARRGNTVIVERCILSSVVFSALYLKDLTYQHDIAKLNKQIHSAKKAHIGFCILYLPPRDINRTAHRMRRQSNLKPFADVKFLAAFDRDLRSMVKTFNR